MDREKLSIGAGNREQCQKIANLSPMSKNLLFFIIGNVLLIILTYLTRKRKRVSNVALLFTAVFLFLSVVETAYRNFFRANRDHFDTTLIFRHDSLLGSRPGGTGFFSSTRLSSAGKTIYHAGYTIVADSNGHSLHFDHRAGYRDPVSPDPTVIFLGCSITFGEGVNDSETLPYQFGALEHISTLNLGGIGYGTHHVYKLFLDNYARENNKNRLFLYTMIPDHVLRAAGVYAWSPGPSFALAGDSLAYSGQLPEVNGRTAYFLSFFGCYSFIKDIVLGLEQRARTNRMSPEDYQKAYVMIRNMSRYAKATGGNFLLLFWDGPSPAGYPGRQFQALLEAKLEELKRNGVWVIRVSDIIDTKDPRYYIPGDGHPNALAYDTVARYLAKHAVMR